MVSLLEEQPKLSERQYPFFGQRYESQEVSKLLEIQNVFIIT